MAENYRGPQDYDSFNIDKVKTLESGKVQLLKHIVTFPPNSDPNLDPSYYTKTGLLRPKKDFDYIFNSLAESKHFVIKKFFELREKNV